MPGWPLRRPTLLRVLVIAFALLASAAWPSQASATTLVALGDSYSSGEGAKSYYGESDRPLNRCHRSSQAWPRLLGATTTYLLACSGATTAQLYSGAPKRDSEGQLRALREVAERRPIDVVTITLGGNDVGFADEVKDCFFLPSVCLPVDVEFEGKLDRLRTDLVRSYRAIQRRAVGARLVVVGYPEIVPRPYETGGCWWLSRTEKERAIVVTRKLNGTIAAAAADADVEFLSIRGALDAHELCTENPWLRGVGEKKTAIQEMGHPNAAGQAAIAAAVRRTARPPLP